MELCVSGIMKSFGEKEVLKGISFTANAGSAFGLLGRNGAGKTTTIRIVMGVFPPDAGTVTIDGGAVSASGKRLGYLPEERGLYPKMKILDQIAYIGMLRGMNRTDARASGRRWLERLRMSESADAKLNTLSKGNQQKIQLAATIVDNPDIVILDEPFSGLDPVNARLLKDVVSELIESGRIVIFSSHQMGYVEEFCDKIAIIGQGEILLEGDLKAIKRGYDRTHMEIRPEGEDGPGKLAALWQDGQLADVCTDFSLRGEVADLQLRDAAQRDKLLHLLMNSGVALEQFSVLEPSLEEIFIEKAGAEDV